MIMPLRKKPAFFLLFLLISFGSVTSILFTPGLPEISAYFGVSRHAAQMLLALFLIGITAGQLLYGPLANGCGRKKALYTGIILEITGALICALSARFLAFWLLSAACVFMALGASVGLIASFTLIADSHTEEESAAAVSHLMIAFAVMPGIGVAIGGFLAQHFGWQSCFYFLALYGMFLLYLVYQMEETVLSIDPGALKFSRIFYQYSRKLKNKQLLSGAALMGCTTAFAFIFSALSPFIAMQLMHLSPSQYGLWSLLPLTGIIIGSQLSAYFAKKLRSIHTVLLGIAIVISGTLAMLAAFILHHLIAIWLFLPFAIIYAGNALIFANASTLVMQSAQDKAGASAMMNFINMGIAAVSVLLIGLIPAQSSLLLPIVYVILAMLTLLLSMALRRNANS